MTSSEKYIKLEDFTSRNLERLVESRDTYIWVRANFTIPPALKNKDLALEIPYVHFAAETYVNGVSIGASGRMPPDIESAYYVSQYFDIGNEILNQNGTNTVYIKIYCLGKSTLGGDIFVGEPDDIKSFSDMITFFRSTVYIFFIGLLFTVCLFFLIIYFSRRKYAEYFSFAMMNFFTIFFLTSFFSGSVPVFNMYRNIGVSYLLFIKMFLCVNTYIIISFYVQFTFAFLKLKENVLAHSIRNSILIAMSILTFTMPTYESLERSTPFMLIVCIANVFYVGIPIYKALRNPEKRHDVVLYLIGFTPVLVSILIDFFVHCVWNSVYFPYFTLIGWFIIIVLFITILTFRFNRAATENEYLNLRLNEEVNRQTERLVTANENLAREISRAQQDLEMASIVQKKYFPYPKKNFKGWDLAVCYEPLSNVSGDLYDYYYKDNKLQGFALFDVSGHGLSASLITMLAKNIIGSLFQRGEKLKESVSSTLVSINDKIIQDKGDIENYLTGLLIKFENFDSKDVCKVSLANAGHPYPLLFEKKTGETCLLMPDSSQKQFGAIGIQGIDVSFPEIKFSMAQGDIFVCYTDGLTEANNSNKEQFGRERLAEIVRVNSSKSAKEILYEINKAFKEFTQNVPRDDDITVIVLKREDSKKFVEQLEMLELEDDDYNKDMEEVADLEIVEEL